MDEGLEEISGGGGMVSGGGRPRLSSHDEGVPAFLEGAGQVGGGGGGRPRVNSTTEEQAEVEIGSLMMEVHAAPSLQLFSGRGGAGGAGRELRDG